MCAGHEGASYAIVQSAGAGCRELVAGRDFADGRVIIGVKPETSDEELGGALEAYHASVIATMPAVGQRLLSVPEGSVPGAVVGMARYTFIVFASPDLLAHTSESQRVLSGR